MYTSAVPIDKDWDVGGVAADVEARSTLRWDFQVEEEEGGTGRRGREPVEEGGHARQHVVELQQ